MENYFVEYCMAVSQTILKILGNIFVPENSFFSKQFKIQGIENKIER